ncbi:MAG: hypothetical protein IJ615_10630 [Bacteroidaceae bacterium]|nr:hypothetical protein [Bacteroidaceae bacterium]
MTIAEIKELESARQNPEQFNVVHFLKENNGYCRAHDWSAWLLKTFPPNDALGDLGVAAKRIKDGYIDAFVGFPATSLKKFIPEAEPYSFTPVDDNHFTITVEIPAEVGEVSYENLSKMKEEWKNGLKLQDSKKQRREDREAQEHAPRIVRFTDIIARIVALPLEDLTPREAYDILRELRREVSSMF